jgi:hypothetical protein
MDDGLGFKGESTLVDSSADKQHRGHDLPSFRPSEGKPYVLLVCSLLLIEVTKLP